MVKAKKFIIASHFKGDPKPSDMKLVEEELRPVKDGEFVVRAEFISLDPYMRVCNPRLPIGSTMVGIQVGTIVESKSPKYPVGKRVVANLGWRTHTVVNLSDTSPDYFTALNLSLLPDLGSLSPSLCLGVLGMPGNTAYFGFIELCKPKAGETLVVSGAAGAVGSHVGQIAKNIYNLKVIGIAGTDAKCKWLVDELGFDAVINYKTQDVAATLKTLAPKGVDCYFDNVGGEISSTVMEQMNCFGRVSVCGSISAYNSIASELPKATVTQVWIVLNQLKIEGFIVNRWLDRWEEGVQKNLQWIREGKLKYHETVTNGFENMFTAFADMLRGGNTGKAIVKV